ISAVMERRGLDLIYLLAPTSSPARQKEVARQSRGFVYYVSLTGVTGVQRNLSKELARQVSSIKRTSSLPVCVGFGISTPAQAKTAAAASDGVIIGSAVVRELNA